MTGCVVCLQDESYCEFCSNPRITLDIHRDPTSTTVIVNRDPGDENDFRPRDPAAAQWLRQAQRDVVVTHRSYKATYQLGDTFYTRTIIGPDSYLDAVAQAEGERNEDEQLVGLTELA